MRKYAKNRGFTILEMVVVVTVIAFITVAALTALAARVEVERANQTRQKMERIMAVIDDYADAFSMLPCPADGEHPFTDSLFGEDPGTAELADSVCGEYNFSDNSGTPPEEEVISGVLPTYTLRLPPSMMLDAWGRRMTYVVHNFMTKMTYYMGDGTTPGDIPVIEVSNLGGGAISTSVAVVLISHGTNGHGAWKGKGDGTRIDEMFTGAEQENAHVGESYDREFIQSIFTPNFDNIIVFRTKEQLRREE